MKTNLKRISFLVAAVATIYSGMSLSHGENKEHEEEAEYDAVSKPFGEYAPGLEPVKTINVSMTDNMRYTPSDMSIEAGDVIRFVLSNDGQIQHEFVLGTQESLAEHAEMMMKFPGMEHEEPYMAHVAPGKTKEMIWKFSKSGTYEFGCLLPGHFAAGMKGSITVDN